MHHIHREEENTAVFGSHGGVVEPGRPNRPFPVHYSGNWGIASFPILRFPAIALFVLIVLVPEV